MSFVNKYRRLLVTLLTLALSALLIASFACGGGDDDDSGGDDETAAATTPADGGNGGGEEVSFDVQMTDEEYIPSDFTVAPGAQVTLNLTNAGTAIHNVRIAGEDNEYNTDDDAVSDPDLVNPGDTAIVEWTAPSDAGDYKYQCDIHPNLGGTFTVE